MTRQRPSYIQTDDEASNSRFNEFMYEVQHLFIVALLCWLFGSNDKSKSKSDLEFFLFRHTSHHCPFARHLKLSSLLLNSGSHGIHTWLKVSIIDPCILNGFHLETPAAALPSEVAGGLAGSVHHGRRT
jgi:hypothetical protein